MYESSLLTDDGPDPQAEAFNWSPKKGADAMDVDDKEMEDITSKLRAFPTPMPPGAWPKDLYVPNIQTTTDAPPAPGAAGTRQKTHPATPKKKPEPRPSSAEFTFGRSAPYSWNPRDGVKYESPVAGGGEATPNAKQNKKRNPETPSPMKEDPFRPRTAPLPKPSPSPFFTPKSDARTQPKTRPFAFPGDHTPSRAAPGAPKPGLFTDCHPKRPRMFTNNYNQHNPHDAPPNGGFSRKVPPHTPKFEYFNGPRKPYTPSFRNQQSGTRHTTFERFMNQAGLGGDPRQTSLPKVNPDQAKGSTKPKKPFGQQQRPFANRDFGIGGLGGASPLFNNTQQKKPYVHVPAPTPQLPPIQRAWIAYMERWSVIKEIGSGAVRMAMIPWPLEKYAGPTSEFAPFTHEITEKTVGDFLFSSFHSHEHSRKKRIQNALRLYHPDKFAKILDRMMNEREKEVTRMAADVLVRLLNDLLEKAEVELEL